MDKKIIFALVAVVFAAGCVNIGGSNQASVDVTNIISVSSSSISIIPNPPLSTNTDFTLSFQIKNNDNRKNVVVETNVFDWGVCEKPNPTKFDFTLVPGQTEIIEIKSKSPSPESIGNLRAECPIQWRTTYTYSTTSSTSFTVLSKEKLTQLQRAGKAVEIPAASSSIGPGPLKINFDFKTDKNYVTSTSPLQFAVTVKDEGEGGLEKIEVGKLSIKVPKDWVPASNACTENFEATNSADENIVLYTNKKSIPFVQRATPELICNFAAPNLDDKNIPQKTYFLSAELKDYVYIIDGKQVVEIKP